MRLKRSDLFGIGMILVLACSPCVEAQQRNTVNPRRGYATDYFAGFDAVDSETRIPQKASSIWYSVEHDTPAAQLAYALQQEKEGSFRAARKGYEALVREWPTSKEACRAQYSLAKLLEKQGDYEDAFDEYQYLLVHYAGACPYDEILDRQFRIANSLLHNNRSMFGFALSGYDQVRRRFEQIVRNAPRSPKAPEVMLIIGGIRENEEDLKNAISVYDGLLNRFPKSSQADQAAYLSARCRYRVAMKQRSNEAKSRDALSFFRALLERRPNHPQKNDLLKWQKVVYNLLIDQNYQKTVFYDSRQRSLKSAKTAYKRFIKEFPNTRYTARAKKRLEELEKGAPPLN